MTKITYRFDLEKYSTLRRKLVEQRLAEYLAPKEPHKLWEAMRYSVLSAGKRIRALLCIACAEAIDIKESQSQKSNEIGEELPFVPCLMETVLPLCCAIEMVHAMSLIHDDLPSMDNDDLRRGKPTNHKVFGEAVALLAGDALLVYGTQILLEKTPRTVEANTLISVAQAMAKAIGPEGMVGGQIFDLAFTGSPAASDNNMVYTSDIEAVERIHLYKTAALIRFSAWSGACIAGASTEQLAVIDQYASVLGLAFQIADDVLDVTADISCLGKTPGKDQVLHKSTWVTCFGLDGAHKKLNELEAEGFTLLDNSDLANYSQATLKALLRYAIHRKK